MKFPARATTVITARLMKMDTEMAMAEMMVPCSVPDCTSVADRAAVAAGARISLELPAI